MTWGAAVQLRQRRLKAARTILGMAIGKAPKPRLFKYYIDLETQLAQVRPPNHATAPLHAEVITRTCTRNCVL